MRPCETLTPIEREVLDFVTLGMTNRQIAARIERTKDAVTAILVKIYDKLGMSERLEIVKWRLSHPYGDIQWKSN